MRFSSKNQMQTKELHYDLPSSHIAQFPTEDRADSRLLVHERSTGKTTHHKVRELPDLLPSPSLIFRNDVSVLKARLLGHRPSGGKVECLLLNSIDSSDNIWKCLLKPGFKTQKAGEFSAPGEFQATILDKTDSGEYVIRFELSREENVSELAGRLGSMPLPPYVRRLPQAIDEERYETVYANPVKRTAAAAPTAGLHFTDELFEELIAKGHSIHDLTLSVGLGTFRPIESENTDDHDMHSESYVLPPQTKKHLRKRAVPSLAIGTTTVRAIEHYLSEKIDPSPEKATVAEADLFIQPPYEFLGVDTLLTNFHLPGSTLLCLVAAFLNPSGNDGLELLKELYAQALSEGYRFYSYGDAMLVL